MADAPAQSRPARRKKLIPLLVVVLLAVGAGAYLYLTKDQVDTDDATIDGHVFAVSPRVAGYVVKVLVSDNESVKRDQPLLALDATEYEVALAEAKANLAEAEATLASLKLGVPLELTQTAQRVRGAQAELESQRKLLEAARQEEQTASHELQAAQAERDKARLDLRRYQGLIKTKVVPQSALDEAETKARTSQAATEAAQARLERARKQRGSVEATIDRLRANLDLAATGEEQATIKARQVEAQQARVELAQARLKQAELNLAYATVLAPVDGHVTKKRVEPGQMVARGQPVLAVVPLRPEEIWVTANFKETQLTKVKPGQKARIKIDAFPDLKLTGRVESIMAGTGAVFSLFPPENAAGNFVKVVQRVPVRIVLDPYAGPSLRLGLSAQPTIYLD